MSDSSPNDVSLFALDTQSWDDAELDELDKQYADALVRGRIRRCLHEAQSELPVDEIVSETDVSKQRVEDGLEILTRERQVAVDQSEAELVFSIDAENRSELGGERLEMWDGERVFEVNAAESVSGKECVKLVEKRVWSNEYEHTVGAVIIPRSAFDQVFSMMNTIDERFVYEDDNSI